jgi:Ca2+-binding EF-hand superfamily protein
MSQATVCSSPEEADLLDKVTRLVDSRFKSDWRRAFDHYASGSTAAVDRDQLITLLDDAGIGNWATRGAWAKGVLKKMDTNGDKRISWTEFQSVSQSGR